MKRIMLALLVGLLLVGGPTTMAQNRIPYGSVVSDANGHLWVVLNDQRHPLAIYPLDPSTIEAIPTSDQWVVPSSRDGWTLDARPDWDTSPR